ncbi:hypothetical protein PENSPDRAFT_607629 [Peniophora sp. CONT]|nr:hypothetical protein PENSPDRAFT_607629 [Peniophora sp. CONT]
MTARFPADKPEKLRALLDRLRDTPEELNPHDVKDVLAWAMAQPTGEDGLHHWYCHRAGELLHMSATYLLCMFSYSNSEKWKSRLGTVLSGCCDCVRGLQEAKRATRQTYLGHYESAVVDHFVSALNEWEAKHVAKLLWDVLDHQPTGDSPAPTLCDAPLPAIFHLASNLSVLQDSSVLSALQKCPTIATNGEKKQILSDWPSGPPAPGLFYLSLHRDEHIRVFFSGILRLSPSVPMSDNDFVGPYMEVVKMLSRIITTSSSGASGSTSLDPSFPFSVEPVILWDTIRVELQYIPVKYLRSSRESSLDLAHAIVGRLHDDGTHFENVLRCFYFTIKRLDSNFWLDRSDEYPQFVFAAIRDNPSFARLLKPLGPGEGLPWYLEGLFDFAWSIWTMPQFGEVLAKMVEFLCGELQHERFKGTKHLAMTTAAKLLSATLNRSQNSPTNCNDQVKAALGALDVNVDRFVSTALSQETCHPDWEDARSLSRELLYLALLGDVKSVLTSVQELSNASRSLKQAKAKSTAPVLPTCTSPSVHDSLWTKYYDHLQTDDVDGMVLLLRVVAPVSHLDALMKNAYRSLLEANGHTRLVFDGVNNGLDVFRARLPQAIEDYQRRNDAKVVDLFQRSGAVQNLIELMLCPVPAIRDAAESLASQPYDVDLRSDCFRALIEHFPESAVNGILAFIDAFVKYLPTAMEACMLSSALVQCLTDVFNVLVDQPDGLLYDQKFLDGQNGFKPAMRMPELWNLMNRALAAVFLYTPHWAVFVEDSQWMVDWMRDAVILGETMVGKWRQFEDAIVRTTSDGSTTRGLSRTGRKMLEDLQIMLADLTRWLRLTDTTLLNRSFDLIKLVLGVFEEAGTTPKQDAVNRIRTDIKKWMKKGTSSRLSRGQLQELLQVTDSFAEDEPEVVEPEIEIVDRPSKQRKLELGGKVATPEPSSSKSLKPTGRTQMTMKDFAGSSARSADSRGFKPTTKPPAATSSSKAKASTSASSSRGNSALMKQAHAAAQAQKNQRLAMTARDNAKLEAARAPAPKTFQPARSASRASSDASGPSDNDAEEASSSDSDEDEGGLAALNALKKTKKKRKRQAEPERRTMILEMDNLPGAARYGRAAFSARDEARRKRQRTRPDVSELHKAILSWEYEHDGPVPPGTPLKAQHVRDVYRTYWDFRTTFEPLLLLECWAQLVQSRSEKQDKYEAAITSRQYADQWLDLDVFIEESLAPGWSLNETDVVLMRHPTSKKSILAKVNSYRTVRGNKVGVHATLRCCLAGRPDPGLSPNTRWQISKAFSLATVHREFGALVSLEFYDHCPFILSPKLPMPSRVDEGEVERTMRKYSLNQPQARAIVSALRSEGFALIQGPPGTGKTSTICSLVQAFIAQRSDTGTVVTAGRSAASADKTAVKKILICAPSNAAIDEVASRIRDRGLSSQTPIKVVRIGAEKALNISTKDLALDALVDERLGGDTAMKGNDEYARVASALQAVKAAIQEKENEASIVMDNTARLQALESDRSALLNKRRDLSKQLNVIKDKNQNESRTLDSRRRDARAAILAEADVICATLSGAGHDNLDSLEFEMIIIDEAAQAIELSTLIPLKFDCKRVVMVGDPQQLPPTVISKEATRYLYNQSLFVRLQKQRPEAVHLLSIQYRMHPEISVLPSQLFYQGRLQDGPDMAERTKRAWQDNPRFGIYRFFNIIGSQETNVGFSATNPMEVQTAVQLYRRLTREFSSIDFTSRIGFISPYREQVKALRNAFRKSFGDDVAGAIDFNTVDGFQGQEKEIIILSCVRAGPGLESIGFLRDVRRLNVAITRAKSSLFILGHAPTLERSDENWRHMVQDARSRQLLTDIDGSYFTGSGAPPVARNSSKAAPPPPPPPPLPKPIVPVMPASSSIPALMTPGQMRSMSSQGSIPSTPSAPEGFSIPPPMPSAPPADSASASKKRPLPAESAAGGSGAEVKPAGPPQKKAKPANKPKDKTKSLFIPKKK